MEFGTSSADSQFDAMNCWYELLNELFPHGFPSLILSFSSNGHYLVKTSVVGFDITEFTTLPCI